MMYRGQVRNGVVIIDGEEKIEEGTVVTIEPVAPEKTLGQSLMELAGIAKGLPSDMADNHDHYIHGTAKRKS
jgi:hypothetical protein